MTKTAVYVSESGCPTWSNLAALLTMLGNWKMLGLNFSCMSQSKSTASLVESLPIFATEIKVTENKKLFCNIELATDR